MKIVVLSFLILGLFGCASTPPAQIITQAPANDITLLEVSQSPSRFFKSPVRWGGRVVKSEEIAQEVLSKHDVLIQNKISQQKVKLPENALPTAPEATVNNDQRLLKLEIVAYPLDQEGKPVQSAEALGGRFIAVLPQPYKKGRYYRNRWVTIAGDVSGTEEYTLANGEGQLLPVVVTQENYAWREEYRDDDYHDYWWPRFYFRYGINHRSSRSGIGLIFNPLRLP